MKRVRLFLFLVGIALSFGGLAGSQWALIPSAQAAPVCKSFDVRMEMVLSSLDHFDVLENDPNLNQASVPKILERLKMFDPVLEERLAKEVGFFQKNCSRLSGNPAYVHTARVIYNGFLSVFKGDKDAHSVALKLTLFIFDQKWIGYTNQSYYEYLKGVPAYEAEYVFRGNHFLASEKNPLTVSAIGTVEKGVLKTPMSTYVFKLNHYDFTETGRNSPEMLKTGPKFSWYYDLGYPVEGILFQPNVEVWIGFRKIYAKGRVEFHPNGMVSSATLAQEGVLLEVNDGVPLELKEDDQVFFDRNGKLITYMRNTPNLGSL